eukprot:14530273-Heterocapsa_arctica.AAC.1
MSTVEQVLEMVLQLRVAQAMVLNGPSGENTSALMRQLNTAIESLTVVADRMREQREKRPEIPEEPEIPERPESPETPETPDRPQRPEDAISSSQWSETRQERFLLA